MLADRDGRLFLEGRDGTGRATRLVPLTTWTARDVVTAARRAARRIVAFRSREQAVPPQRIGRLRL